VHALSVHDTDAARRDTLLRKLAGYSALQPWAGSGDPRGFDLVINATPMGMSPVDVLPLDAALLDASSFVGDVVTVPEVTPLLATARERGCPTMTGMAMFEAVRDGIVEFFLEPT
jgi:shikimate dehydrogenase